MIIESIVTLMIKLFLPGTFWIAWLITSFYISKIKKYGYDERYCGATARLKFYWGMLIYCSILLSYILTDELFNQNIIRFILFTLNSVILIMVSFVFFLRFINAEPKRKKYFEKYNLCDIGILKKSIVVTNIVTFIYSLLFTFFQFG